MSEEKTLEDFFSSSEPEYSSLRKTKEERSKKKKKKNRISSFFRNRFVFDENCDLSDPANVLYRKNYCIKSLAFLANIVFVLFSLVGISSSNYIITIVFWIIMTGLSQTIGYMLRHKKDDLDHQIIIMYLQSIFIFLLSIVLYIKVYIGFTLLSGKGEMTTTEFSITQASYILIFFTFVIISLYQDTKLLRAMFLWSFLSMLILNITTLHPDLYGHASSLDELIGYITGDNTGIITDIVLRMFTHLVFFASLFISVSISKGVSEDRRSEFEKRMDVEETFKSVTNCVFEAIKTYDIGSDTYEERRLSKRVQSVAKEISVAMNLKTTDIIDIKSFSTIHVDRTRELMSEGIRDIEEYGLKYVMNRTKLAEDILKRLQLRKRAKDIILTFFQEKMDRNFIEEMSYDKNDTTMNVVLLSELYCLLRMELPYKRELTHQRVMELIEREFHRFFDPNLITRFQKYGFEIKTAYERA